MTSWSPLVHESLFFEAFWPQWRWRCQVPYSYTEAGDGIRGWHFLSLSASQVPSFKFPWCDSDQNGSKECVAIALVDWFDCRLRPWVQFYKFLAWHLYRQKTATKTATGWRTAKHDRYWQIVAVLAFGSGHRSRLHNRNIETHSFRSWQILADSGRVYGTDGTVKPLTFKDFRFPDHFDPFFIFFRNFVDLHRSRPGPFPDYEAHWASLPGWVTMIGSQIAQQRAASLRAMLMVALKKWLHRTWKRNEGNTFEINVWNRRDKIEKPRETAVHSTCFKMFGTCFHLCKHDPFM